MSAVAECESGMTCASCGVAGCDDIKLRKCTACYLVRYCSVKCQKSHRKQHKRECKKRAAELRDEAAELRDEFLFKQPESSYLGDCPICYLPLSLDVSKSTMKACCSKTICNGCIYAIMFQSSAVHGKCPFCRAATPSGGEEIKKQRMKRIEMNDPVAMKYQGQFEYDNGDHQSAYEYWKKAAKLGDASAHWQLAQLYNLGHGVENDEGKYIHHLEEAAIGGHPKARHYLGCQDTVNGKSERTVKHFFIAATQGYDESIELLKFAFKDGKISKEDFATALRAHQAAVDATKSPQREKAEEYVRMRTIVERQISEGRYD
eukprot:scaffold2919_cov130-Skeletonema_menzelii.AAC.3